MPEIVNPSNRDTMEEPRSERPQEASQSHCPTPVTPDAQMAPQQAYPVTPGQARDDVLGARQVPVVNIDQVALFWEKYNKAADFEDREFVRALGVNLDTLLIFAGLFSGVNTAFILEALKVLQPDHTEKANDLTRSVIILLQNMTADNLLREERFEPTVRSVRCTSFFFASLCCALAAALGAVLGKQWLNHYEREGRLKPPPERGRERQQKHEACAEWHLEGVIEALPNILQISLFLFLIAMAEFLQPINATVSLTAMAFALVPTLFYTVTLIIAVAYPTSPFQTRLSKSVPMLWSWGKRKLRFGFFVLLVWTSRINIVNLQYTVSRLWRKCRSAVYKLRKLGSFWRLWSFTRSVLHTHTSTPPTRSATTQLPMQPYSIQDTQTLGCLVFVMKRASTTEDTNAVIAALDGLSPDLLVDPEHPVVALLAETTFHFLRLADHGPTVWLPPEINFRHALKIIYLLYVRWRYFQQGKAQLPWPFATVPRHDSQLHHSIGAALKALFLSDPTNVASVTLIAGIMEAMPFRTTVSDDVWHQLCCCLQQPAQDVTNYLPYIKLFAYCACDPFAPNSIFHASKIRGVLISTMWIGGEPDEDYLRGWLRIESLPMDPDDKLRECNFSQYLAQWYTRYGFGESPMPGYQHRAMSSYVKAVWTLLQSEHGSHLWLQQLEEDGHLSLLLQTVRQLPPGTSVRDRLSVRVSAICCVLTIWHRCQQEPLGLSDEVFLSSGAVVAVVQFLARYLRTRYDLSVEFLGFRATLRLTGVEPSVVLEHWVLFLEWASNRGLLSVGMEPAIEGYKLLGEMLLVDNSERQQLFERVGRLTFI